MQIPTPIIEALRQARHVTVFTGAGISAESGIATFRDKGVGLWQRFNPADLATPEAFLRAPALVWGWYESRRLQVSAAQPNAGHLAIVELAKRVSSFSVVTQNVDDLHERAGSQNVIHLHGSLFAPRCFDCSAPYKGELCTSAPDGPVKPPRCEECGGMVRPGVVWFEEALPEDSFSEADQAIRQADCFLSIGTSGLVQPAASFYKLALANGAVVVHVNPDAVGGGADGEFALRGAAGVVLPELLRMLNGDIG
jgi:NAD-dependent deacetylase